MEEQKKVLLAFAKWVQAKDEKLAGVPIQELVPYLVEALQTEEGQELFQQFQSEMNTTLAEGGKISYLSNLLKNSIFQGIDPSKSVITQDGYFTPDLKNKLMEKYQFRPQNPLNNPFNNSYDTPFYELNPNRYDPWDLKPEKYPISDPPTKEDLLRYKHMV